MSEWTHPVSAHWRQPDACKKTHAKFRKVRKLTQNWLHSSAGYVSPMPLGVLNFTLQADGDETCTEPTNKIRHPQRWDPPRCPLQSLPHPVAVCGGRCSAEPRNVRGAATCHEHTCVAILRASWLHGAAARQSGSHASSVPARRAPRDSARSCSMSVPRRTPGFM